ncbi:MAG: DUF1844 domain-containing protein [Pyrinomonadaceae bacterium]
MTEENVNEEETTFKIADRRKFNVDGSLREGVIIEEPKPQPVAAETPSVTATELQPAETPFSETEPIDLPADEPIDFSMNLATDSLAEETQPEEFPDDAPFDESNIPGAENPASFANFLLSLASQAAAAMGLTENPMTGKRAADLETSRYWLEVLAMLHEKTKGNLHPQEQKLYDGLLSDLRMQYVQLARLAEVQMKKQEAEMMKNAAQKFSGKDILGR